MMPMTGRHESPDDGTLELVRNLLHEALRVQRGGRVPTDAMRGSTRAVCACARAHGVPVERVLVALKEEWRHAPETRDLRATEATSLLERIVTLCITEFYADTPPH
jgi:hypothetical protein